MGETEQEKLENEMRDVMTAFECMARSFQNKGVENFENYSQERKAYIKNKLKKSTDPIDIKIAQISAEAHTKAKILMASEKKLTISHEKKVYKGKTTDLIRAIKNSAQKHVKKGNNEIARGLLESEFINEKLGLSKDEIGEPELR